MRPALILLILVSAAYAGTVTCTPGVVSVPVLNPADTSAAVGDYTLSCSGGDPVNPLPMVNVEAFLNVVALHIGTPMLTDGVNNYPGVFMLSNEIVFTGVLFDPTGINFEVKNLVVDPSSQSPGFEFREVVEITGSVTLTIPLPDQLVAVNASVPEPSSLPMAGLGLSGLILFVRNQRGALRQRQRCAAIDGQPSPRRL